jgi:hypothetical protein
MDQRYRAELVSRSCRKRAGGVIDRSKARDNPLVAMAIKAAKLLGTRAAETILASVHMSAPTGRTYARKRSDQNIRLPLLQEGAVHICHKGTVCLRQSTVRITGIIQPVRCWKTDFKRDKPVK